jgi:putative addiction module component (TIGR02574 family)
MSILSQHQIASLSYTEKIALIDELWASLDCSEIGASLDDAYDRLMEQRLADCDAETDVLITLDRASRQLREMLRGASMYTVGAPDAA